MNDVQSKYAPPRLAALVIGVLVFAAYYGLWRDSLISTSYQKYPAPLFLEIISAIVIGYGFTMLGWLIAQTKGQLRETFRPTRGRVIATIILFLVTPVTIFNYLPWIVLGMLPLVSIDFPLEGVLTMGAMMLAIYLIASMIVRHTYERRWLRFGLFALTFWTAYCSLTLINGVTEFRI